MSQRIRGILIFATGLIALFVLSGCLTTETAATAAAVDPDPDPGPISPPSNTAPTIGGTPPSVVRVGVNYSFVPTASDRDGNPIAFTIENKPSWANFDNASGNLFGVPFLGSDGTYEGIVITVTDGSLDTSLGPFAIVVEAEDSANQRPQISGTPPSSVLVDELYSFRPDASDPDDDRMTFTMTSSPAWLGVNPESGTVSGTPTANDMGVHARIRVSVSDGEFTSNLPLFTVTVFSENTPPEISGTPPTQVTVGQEYTFTPEALDVDSDRLTFSVANPPGWATFESDTGELSGTPENGDEQTYQNIVISVSDEVSTTDLNAFNITVNAASVGSAELTWDPPELNTDGSDLQDLAGYVIYYGQSANQMNNQIPLDDANAIRFTVENLSPATYFFGISARNNAGALSEMSNTANKIVD
jgi:hypothetical protein